MTHVSRPLIAVLLGAVVFFAVWTVALKPHSSTSGGGGSSSGVGSYQSAIDKAHQAVATSDKASAAHGGTLPPSATTGTARGTQTTTTAGSASSTTAHAATAPSTATATTAGATTAGATTGSAVAATPTPATSAASASATASTPTVSAAQQRLSTTEHALDSGEVVALLFYNPAAADDRAMRQELSAVPANGQVVKLAVPLSEAGTYTFITAHVPLDTSPTLVLIDRSKQATTIVGFADRFEIAQRIADALAVPAK
jgi:hypothetical protein